MKQSALDRAALAARVCLLPLLSACSANNGAPPKEDPLQQDASVTLPGPVIPGACDTCTDFPKDPILDGAAKLPGDVASLFQGDGSDGGGPCLIEPESRSLIPQNWLSPRFRMAKGDNMSVFEIRLHVDNQANDLVVYTKSRTWTMPEDMWRQLAEHSAEHPIEFSVRGLDTSKTPPAVHAGTKGQITVSKVAAKGTIVYWTTSGGSALKGFKAWEKGVVNVLNPAQSGGKCIGCHTSTPDGKFVGFSSSSSSDDGDQSIIALRSGDGKASSPDFLSATAKTLLGRVGQELPSFSKAHWSDGDRVGLSMFNGKVAWTDLEATSAAENTGWGYLTRTGDARQAATPVFSHDGKTVVYTSATTVNTSGVLAGGDVMIVPFNDRKGGTARRLSGASDSAASEFYPTFAPDDQMVAYTRIGSVTEDSYNNPLSEVYVTKSSGGEAVRLQANSPAACLKSKSPGVTNSWPKWSPELQQVGTKTYYWLIFSSTRDETGTPQLYVTPVVRDGDKIESYPALYLWNQPSNESNHTPAWDVFEIPLADPN